MAASLASSAPATCGFKAPDVFTSKQHSNAARSLSTLEIRAEGLLLLILCAINYL